VGFAQYGRNFGALIEAVNIVGCSSMADCWACSCWLSFSNQWRERAFFGVLAGEAAIFAANLFY